MDNPIIYEMPEMKLTSMVVAFAGWPDASEGATRALRYLVRRLPAKKFAEIDPEEFYDFTLVRPVTRVNRQGQRVLRWPTNDFYYWVGEGKAEGLLLYLGTEPSLKWKTYSQMLLTMAEQCGVKQIVTLGALLDAVPHAREASVTGRASSEALRQKVEWLGVGNSGYQGPTGIHSVFMDACNRRNIPYASIWGHSPHYIRTTPNPKVSHALLDKLRSLVDFDLDLGELKAASETFEEEISRFIAKEPELDSYVQKLEQRYDAAVAGSQEEMPSSESIVSDLEDFLRSQREKPEEEPDQEPNE